MLPPVVSGSDTIFDLTPCSFFRFLYSENGMRRTEGALGGEGCLAAAVGASSRARDLGGVAVLAVGGGVGSVVVGGLGGLRGLGSLGGAGGRLAVDGISACGCSSSSIKSSCLGIGRMGGVVRMVVGLRGGGGEGCASPTGTLPSSCDSKTPFLNVCLTAIDSLRGGGGTERGVFTLGVLFPLRIPMNAP